MGGALDADALARLCTEAYERLPGSGKPVQGPQQRQWTVLSAAVLTWPASVAVPVQDGEQDGERDGDQCQGQGQGQGRALVSLATGVKCLPYTFFHQHGDVVHDQHAETLVRRGLRRWILRQVLADAGLAEQPLGTSLPQPVFLPPQRNRPDAGTGTGGWSWNPFYQLSLYVSRVPCGAASAALLPEQEASQPACATAIEVEEASKAQDQAGESQDQAGVDVHAAAQRGAGGSAVRGRRDLSQRGCVRTKPGRADAPVGTSMSCSDKLALWGVVGLQGSLLSRLLDGPVRYAHLVVGLDGLASNSTGTGAGTGQVDAARAKLLKEHLLRAVVERVGVGEQVGGSGGPVQVHVTPHPFVHGQDAVAGLPGGPLIACADALSHVPSLGVSRLSPLGTKAGAPAKRRAGAALRPQARAPLCKAMWYAEFIAAAAQLGMDLDSTPSDEQYGAAKRTGSGSKAYRAHKAAVRGSDAQGLHALRQFLHQHHVPVDLPPPPQPEPEAETSTQAPLAGWLVTGPTCESFSLP